LLELALAEATTLIATTPTTPSSRTGDLRKTFVTAHSFSLFSVRRIGALPRVPPFDRREAAASAGSPR
jgi:hypothetical protein